MSDYNETTPCSLIEAAMREIFVQYGHETRLGRKSLSKYGLNAAVTSSGRFDINSFSVGSAATETYLTTNAVTHFSSDVDAADRGLPVYIEGMTRSGDILTFTVQTVYLDASDARTKTALDTPLCDVTRVRTAATGNVYIYEDGAVTNGEPDDATIIHNVGVAGEGSSLKAATSVASNNYFLVLGLYASIGRASSTNVVDFRFQEAQLGDAILGDAFVTKLMPWSVGAGTDIRGPLGPKGYHITRPNSRVKVVGQASGGTINAKAGFFGVFLDIPT